MTKPEDLLEMCKSYNDGMTTEQIKNLLDSSNMLYRHTLTNRILIDIQSNEHKVNDVRTPEEWFVLGRRVKDTTKQIKMLNIVDVDTFIDKVTGKEIGLRDLSPEELRIATEHGIIERASEELYTRVVNGYDVSNTYEIKSGLYIEKVSFGFFNINKVCKNIYNVEFEVAGAKEIDTSIEVPNDPLVAIDIIIEKIIEMNLGVNRGALRYALKTMLGIECELDVDNVPLEELEAVRNIVMRIKREYLEVTGYSEQATIDIDLVERSKRMLPMLQMCLIYSRVS